MLENKIAEARRTVERELTAEALPGACLYHAVALHMVLPEARIIAGSYSWRFTNKDDGKNPTNFSCIFDKKAQALTVELLANPDRLRDLPAFPEMHVFNYYQGKILDISTRWIPQFAQKACGFFFDEMLRPPPYLWDVPIHKNKRWIYAPHPLATELAKLSAYQVLR